MSTEVDVVRPVIQGIEGLELNQNDFIMPYGSIDRFSGKIINSLTEQELPKEFIPLKIWQRWVKFEDMKLIWSITDRNDPRTKEAEWGPDGQKPTADKTIQVLCLFKGEDIPVIITFKRTSYRAGQAFLTMATTGVVKAIFEKKFELSTIQLENKKKQKYYVYKVNSLDKTSEKERETAALLYQMFKEHAAKAEIPETEDEYPVM